VDFIPDRYIRWLAEQAFQKINIRRQDTRCLLRVESGVDVLGRRLELSKEKSSGQTCALEIYPSAMVYLKAPSGVGKTTFAKSLMGLVDADRLLMTMKGVVIDERVPKQFWRNQIWGKQMVMTFQHADEALNQNSTVQGALSGFPVKMSSKGIRALLVELFGADIDERFLMTKVKYLSGGQKQKLNLLRSFILDTDLLILDEPFNGLDFESTVKVLSLLRTKQEEGKGILLISHNEEIFDTAIPEEHVYYLRASLL
jgi:ABC-type multidrug transport system ATPase subunit